ncbi:STAS domain-containing protein [Ruminococcus sp. NK3A76]|uniref:STAS domain-containing protein n=1 Tax=Ruminococcus sp. NK3A76 TaxID=877411 RepID=UPI0004901DB2|nr:STAS domain-containing protein [Ruminococcus sp. NK3A76]
MEIRENRNGSELTVALVGRLDTLSSPELEEKLEDMLEGVEKLVFDFAELRYISSAGLRVMLTAMQIMEDQGEMTVKNVCQDVMDVFEVTGFVDDLNIE